jgi:large subunit ribosomal protein L22
MIEGRATARYVRGSAQKARLVLDLIRGKDVDKAISTLRFVRKGVAKDVEKVLRSAVANAQQKDGAGDDVDRLYVAECFADQGPTAKRIRAAPMGRAFRIMKRTSHLTVAVGQRQEVGGFVERVGDMENPVVDDGAVEGSGVTKKQTKKARKTSASKSADA